MSKKIQRKPKLQRFICAYAYDQPCFADFVVEATSERAAKRIINKALRDGRFDNATCEPSYENQPTGHRVFVMGPAEPHFTTTLAELCGEVTP